jgi:hypothetical protein
VRVRVSLHMSKKFKASSYDMFRLWLKSHHQVSLELQTTSTSNEQMKRSFKKKIIQHRTLKTSRRKKDYTDRNRIVVALERSQSQVKGEFTSENEIQADSYDMFRLWLKSHHQV